MPGAMPWEISTSRPVSSFPPKLVFVLPFSRMLRRWLGASWIAEHELGVVGLFPVAVHGVSTVRAVSPVVVANAVAAAWTSPAPHSV